MTNRRMVVGIVVFLLGVAVGSQHPTVARWFPSWPTSEPMAAPAPPSKTTAPVGVPLPSAAPSSFSEIATSASPAVVNVATTQKAPERSGGPSQRPPSPGPFGEQDPFEEFFRRFGPPERSLPRRSLGSGFVIGDDGTIVTNHHVVANADKIVVRLAANGSEEYEAKLLGSDPKTDLALLKIEANGALPVLRLGDSDGLRVGDWVVAIGNPFGLENTVTAGIVSAKERVIGAGPYDDFIQTDASINPGNSGGPLLNLQGEVVGINSAIFSRSGGNMGIGFATPVNLAHAIIDQLKETGRVVRGWLGVSIQDVDQALAESFGLEEARGALVADVLAGGPAKKAGLERGDIIVSWRGNEIAASRELPTAVAATRPGTKAEIEVLREGEKRAIRVEVGEMPEEVAAAGGEGEAAPGGAFGLSVAPVTPEIANRLGIEAGEGILIDGVRGGSPAANAGLRPGDVILEVDREAVSSVDAFRKAMAEAEGTVLFLVRRGENTIFLALRRE